MSLSPLESSQAPLLLPLGISPAVEEGNSNQDFESFGQTPAGGCSQPQIPVTPGPKLAPHPGLEALSHPGEGDKKSPGIWARRAPRTWCQGLGAARGSSSAPGERVQHLGTQGGAGVQAHPGGPNLGLPALKSTGTQVLLGCFHGCWGGVCQEQGKSSQRVSPATAGRGKGPWLLQTQPLAQGQRPRGLTHVSEHSESALGHSLPATVPGSAGTQPTHPSRARAGLAVTPLLPNLTLPGL